MLNGSKDLGEQATNMTAACWCHEWEKLIQRYHRIAFQIRPDPSEVNTKESTKNWIRSLVEIAISYLNPVQARYMRV